MQMFTIIKCDAGFKNNIDELGFIFQFDLKSLYNLIPRVFCVEDVNEMGKCKFPDENSSLQFWLMGFH